MRLSFLGMPEPQTTQAMRERLESLLDLWRPRHPWDRGDPYHFGTELRSSDPLLFERWCELLRSAVAIPPRTFRPGLQVLLHLHGFPEAVELLESQGRILARGNRIGIPFGAKLPHPDGWTLGVPLDPSTEFETLVQARFKERHDSACGVLLSAGMYADRWEDTAVLTRLALDAPDAGSLFEVWAKAAAFGLEMQLIESLPEERCGLLAHEFRDRVVRESETLGFETDIEFEAFIEGHRHGPYKRRYPPCPLGVLLDSEAALEYSPHPALDTFYFEALAEGLAAAGHIGPIVDMLNAVPPGRVTLALLAHLQLWQPAKLARLYMHESWCHFGVLGVLNIPESIHKGGRLNVDLSEERDEARKLGIRLLVAVSSGELDNVLALGLHLAGQHLVAQARSRGTREARSLFEEVIRACAQPALADQVAGRICAWLGAGEVDDRAMALGCWIADAISSHAPRASAGLCKALVCAYASRLEIGSGSRQSHFQSAVYEKGADAFVLLRESDPESWQLLLRPVDFRSALRSVRSRESMQDYELERHVVDAVLAHASLLLRLADAAQTDVVDEVLDAFDDLLDAERSAGLSVSPFSDSGAPLYGSLDLSQPAEIPRRLGQLAKTSQRALRSVRRVQRSSPDAIILGWITEGLGEQNPMATELRVHVDDLAAESLASEDVSVAQTLGLAVMLTRVGLPERALHACDATLTLVAKAGDHHLARYAEYTTALKAANLADLKRWPDVQALSDPTDRHLLGHVLNFKALADMETRSDVDAERRLERVLQIDPTNWMALVNMTGVLLRQQRWDDALRAVATARAVRPMGDSVLDGNEKLAKARGVVDMDEPAAPGPMLDHESAKLIAEQVALAIRKDPEMSSKVVITGDNNTVAVASGAGASAVAAQAPSAIEPFREQIAAAREELESRRAELEERMGGAYTLCRMLFQELQQLADHVSTVDELATLAKGTADDAAAKHFVRELRGPGVSDALEAARLVAPTVRVVLDVLRILSVAP